METLFQLHADIDTRVETMVNQHPEWPCRLGCDACCRSLADVPVLTSDEWRVLREALDDLPDEIYADIAGRLDALVAAPARPIICPFLDCSAGACRVYAYRPLACRTYGFYLERGVGLYCKEIEARVARGDFADVIWGNQEAIDRCAKDLGVRRSLKDWFAEWAQERTLNPP